MSFGLQSGRGSEVQVTPGCWRWVNGGVIALFVRVSPGAKFDDISGVWTGSDGEARLAVKVSAPPDKGKANAAIIKLLAKSLGASKSSIKIASGEASRLKTIEIRGETEELAVRLDALVRAAG